VRQHGSEHRETGEPGEPRGPGGPGAPALRRRAISREALGDSGPGEQPRARVVLHRPARINADVDWPQADGEE
jgi:hypothetical protein